MVSGFPLTSFPPKPIDAVNQVSRMAWHCLFQLLKMVKCCCNNSIYINQHREQRTKPLKTVPNIIDALLKPQSRPILEEAHAMRAN